MPEKYPKSSSEEPLTSKVESMKDLALNTNPLIHQVLTDTHEDEPRGNELGEYESESVQKTLDPNFVHPKILDARQVQDQLILERYKGKKLRIADIGCGDGYHGEDFGPSCETYHGFEISSEMARKTRERWKEGGLNNSQVFEGDAGQIELQKEFYDVAWSLYFTSGNFREEFKDLKQYDDAYLDKNPAFIRIIQNFYQALKPGGKMFLTVYRDKPETEKAQREFYRMTGQKVVTPLGSRFVATKENFWSVRWTEESMFSNLEACGISPEQVKFNELNDISWLVEITKPDVQAQEQLAA